MLIAAHSSMRRRIRALAPAAGRAGERRRSAVGLVDHRHRHVPCCSMRYATALASSPTRAILGFRRHDSVRRARKDFSPRSTSRLKIAGRQYPFDAATFHPRRWRCRGAGDHDDRLPHRITVGEHGQVVAKHDLFDTHDELPARARRRDGSGRSPRAESLFPGAAPPPARRPAPARPSCSSSARDRADTPLRAPPASSETSQFRASAEAGSPVIAMVRTPKPFKCASSARSSSDSPLFEMRIATSRRRRCRGRRGRCRPG